MSDTHRIEGIKLNFDRLDRSELEGIRGHLLERHARLMGEIALVESYLFPDQQEQLPFEGGELIAFPPRTAEIPDGAA